MAKCPKCHQENSAASRFCGHCGTRLQAEATQATPLPRREVRRTVTIVFSDLKASTSLGERLDPEALHEVKDRYFAAMAAEITRHGGKIEKYIGEALMAVFGLPVQHEDDALRAVRAAMDMQATLRRLNSQLLAAYAVELASRTGVNTGEVVANEDAAADQKLATGDTVNVAARLEQAAPANEVYIGEATWTLVRDAVRVERVGSLELKGKSQLVTAFRLLSATGEDGAVRRHDMPIMGREAELATVDQVLREVRQTARARLVTLVGDAGIGKSRLAQEVIARAGASARVVRGRCLAYGDGITFWPLRGMVGEAAGIATEDPAERAFEKVLRTVVDADVAHRLASAIGLIQATFPLHETTWATRKFLGTLAAGNPVVALIEDIHWADAAFLDLLESVLHAKDTGPILFLCTARHDLLERRGDWGKDEQSLRLVLRPLSADAAAAVAREVLGRGELAGAVLDRLLRAAGGNPFNLEQILSMLVETRLLELREGRWALNAGQDQIMAPPTIKALLESRIGQLSSEERATIEPASVVGLQFPVAAVESMTADPFRTTVKQSLLTLERKQVVTAVREAEELLTYGFHHQLVRDTVYNGLLKRSRAKLHVEFVRWSDQVNAHRRRGLEYEEILGYHLEQAQRYLRELGPLDDEAEEIGRDASRRLSSAGRRAFARGNLHAAASLLTRSLATLRDTDPLRIPLLPELGEVLLELGRFTDAHALVDEALGTAQPQRDRRVAASAEVVRLLLRLHGGEEADWLAVEASLVQRTIPALELEDAHGDIAKAWRLVAMVQQNSGRFDEAGGNIAKVVEHARLAGDQRLVARSALGLALSALYGSTPVAQAIQKCEALIADDLADRQVENLIACTIAQLRAMNGDIDIAREMSRRARAMLRDLGPGVRTASASFDVAMVEMLAGNPITAELELRPDCEMLKDMGETYLLSSMTALLARAVREQGRDDEALEITQLAENTAAPTDVDAQVHWRCVRAPILARVGAHEQAEALVRAALDRATQVGFPSLLASAWSELASVLRVRGKPDESRDALEKALKIYSAKGDRMSAQRLRATLIAT